MNDENEDYLRPFFYRANIKPRNDPARIFERFETLDYCKDRRQYYIRLLDRWLTDNDEDLGEWETGYRRDTEMDWKSAQVRSLRNKLECCRVFHECGSPACPVCRRRYRQWYVSQFLELAAGREFWFLTYVPEEGPVQQRALQRHMLVTRRKRLLKRLERKCPPSTQMVGSTDFKLRLNGTVEPHFHVLVLGCSVKRLRNAKPKPPKRNRELVSSLRPKRKRGRGAPWVVMEVPSDEWLDVISYTARQTPKRDEVGGSYYNSFVREKHEPLLIEQLLFLDQCEWTDLLVLLRAQKKQGVNLRSNIE